VENAVSSGKIERMAKKPNNVEQSAPVSAREMIPAERGMVGRPILLVGFYRRPDGTKVVSLNDDLSIWLRSLSDAEKSDFAARVTEMIAREIIDKKPPRSYIPDFKDLFQ